MARCPHCNVALKPWNIKAECPACKVNIPNYQWEEMLDRDSEIAESCFNKLNETKAAIKYAFTGSKLRIARIPISVLPLIGLLLPLGTVVISIPFCSESITLNIITIFKKLLGLNSDFLMALIGSDLLREQAHLMLISAFCFVLSVLSLPVSLAFLIFNYKKLDSKGLFITNLTASFFLAFSGFCYDRFISTFGNIVSAMNGGISFGFFIAVALFLA